MKNSWLAKKITIIKNPLPGLNWGQRCFVKLLMLAFGHLITVENPEELNSLPEPLIFAFNHNNSFEAILVPCYLIYLRSGKKISFIIDWMFGRIPLIGFIFKQIDPVYVYNKPSTIHFLNRSRRKDRIGTITQQCLDRLNNGKSLGIFPEGTRNNHSGKLLRGKSGIGEIAIKSEIPVVPIGIYFTKLNREGNIPEFGRMILRIGKPLTFSGEIAEYQNNNLTKSNLKAQRKLQIHLHSLVTYRIMNRLADLSGKNYPFPKPELNKT